MPLNQQQMPVNMLYVLGAFPSATEHFIRQEIEALQQQRYYITVISLQKGYAGGEIPAGVSVLYDAPALHPAKLFAFFSFVFRHPFLFYRLLRNARRFSQKHFLKCLRDVWSACYLYRQLPRSDFHRVHAHFAGRPADAGYLLSRLCGKPFAFSAHAHDIYTAPQTLGQKLALADYVITCTAANKKYLQQVCGAGMAHKIHLVYHGLPVDEWPFHEQHTITAAPNMLLSVARLVPKKGLQVLLQALLLLRREGMDCRLQIIGEGPEEKALKNFCLANDLDGAVTFTPFVPRHTLPDYFRRAAIFVLPCMVADDGDRDGIPNVMAEAMACGLPVVSTMISAIPELVEHGRTGLLTAPGDAVALAAAIRQLLTNETLRHTMAVAARKQVETFFTTTAATAALRRVFENTEPVNT
jgi:colanic acid/amylovoran biosynthesis glycosyltransferase